MPQSKMAMRIILIVVGFAALTSGVVFLVLSLENANPPQPILAPYMIDQQDMGATPGQVSLTLDPNTHYWISAYAGTGPKSSGSDAEVSFHLTVLLDGQVIHNETFYDFSIGTIGENGLNQAYAFVSWNSDIQANHAADLSIRYDNGTMDKGAITIYANIPDVAKYFVTNPTWVVVYSTLMILAGSLLSVLTIVKIKLHK